MKVFFCVLVACLLASTAYGRNEIVIDDFFPSLPSVTIETNTTAAMVSGGRFQTGTPIIGGQRDVFLTLSASPFVTASISVTQSRLSCAYAQDSDGLVRVSWDGNADSDFSQPDISPGLGGADLTINNGFAITLNITTDHEVEYDIFIYGGGGISTVTAMVPDLGESVQQFFVFPFSTFSGNADFTDVDAIELEIGINITAIDTSISLISIFTYEVCGNVYEDCDGDGVFDLDELALQDIEATIVAVNNPGVILETELSDVSGDFCFTGFESAFPAGQSFTICVDDVNGGRNPTVPASGCITVLLDNLIDPPISEFGLALASAVSAPPDATVECGSNISPAVLGTGTSSGCISGVPTFVDVSNNDPCDEVITRTWSLNGFQDVQIITVEDTTAPFFTVAPSSLSEACETANIANWVSSNAGATCGDACNSATPSNNWDGSQPNPAACGAVSVGFFCVDTCGNSNSVTTVTYTSLDSTSPTISPQATGQNVQCSSTAINSYNSWLASRAGSSATDNCSGVTTTDNRSGVTNTCSDSDTVTWFYTDSCGNRAQTSATFQISDTTDPVWNIDPQDNGGECGVNAQSNWDSWLNSNGGGSASDSCTAVTISNNAGPSPPVSCDQTVTVTFVASDACGRTASRTADFTVEDNTNPVITSPSTPLSVSCSDSTAASQINTWLNSAGGATTSDACFPGVTITNDYDGNTANCSGELVNFTICDPCNQCVTTSSTLSVDDITDPVFSTPPADETAECDSGAQAAYNDWLDNDGFSIVTDDCTAPQNIFVTNNITSGNGGGNNGGGFEDKIIIDDFTVTTPVVVVITSGAGAPPALSDSSFDSGVSILGSERDVIVTILSGNSGAVLTAGTSNSEFTTTAPSNAEGEVRLQYDGVDGSENLDSASGLGGLDFSAGNALRFSAASDISTTFDVTLCSTGSVCDTETISVVGSVGFQDFTINFTSFSGVNVNSISALEFFIDSDTAVDFTLDVISVIGPLSVPVPLGCLTETYVGFTAQDICGNSATEVAIFTVIDTTRPTIVDFPQSVTEECTNQGSTNQVNYDTWRSTNAGATATDICSSVGFTNDAPNDITTGGCSNTIVANFFATDGCGNVQPATASYTVRDTTPPVFTIDASDFSEDCGGDVDGDLQAWLSSRGGAVATDTCSTVTYSNNFSSLTAGCTQEALVTFTAFDECGNADTSSATFVVDDNQPPVLLQAAADQSEQCDSNFSTALATWLNTAGGAQVTDACQDDNTIQLTNNFNTALTDCDQEAVTFTFTDLCGQSVRTTATFFVIDSSAPVFTTPAQNTEVECDGAGNVGDYASFVNSRAGSVATDQCALSLTFTNNAPAVGPVGCGAVSVAFTVADECGNSASTGATYEVVDTAAPSFSVAPQDASAQCNPASNTANIQAWVDDRANAVEFDRCTSDDNLSLSVSNGQISGDLCNQLHTYTFFVSDECGNTNSDTAVFTIFDLQAPVWDVDPQDVSFECDGNDNTNDVQAWLAQDGLGSASDACNQVTITNDFTVTPAPCTNTLVNFIATDACGNSVTRDAILAIDDSTPPSFANFPADVDVPCDADVTPSTTGSPDLVDSCYASESLGLSFNDVFVNEPDTGDCPGDLVITRTFTATDPCGNSFNQDQIIRISIARSSGPCDPVGCECDACCPASAPADCLPSDCQATACSSTPCAPVSCTCANGKNVHPESGLERVVLPQCEPVYIYVYDDDDSNSTESNDLEKPLVIADKEIEINERRTRRTRHRDHAQRALPEVDAAAAKGWFDQLFQ